MSCRIPPTILHTKGENTRSFIVYSVWDNKTDKAVIIDGEARKCAEAMGISFSSFYSIVSRLRKGQGKRWTISSRYLDGGYRRTWCGKKGGE